MLTMSGNEISLDHLQKALGKRYRLVHEIGRGGMGIVYLAHEPGLDRPVALKVLPPGFAADRKQRDQFLREARTAAKLSHANIVPVYAAGRAGPYAWFTMEYIDGETLGQRVRAQGPLPIGKATEVLSDVARGLGFAHDRGVVHRDVKPDNIIIERDTGRVMVMDFGISQRGAEPGFVKEGYVAGTAHYMSPERAGGGPADASSDVYAMGVIGYYTVTGAVPFDGETVDDIFRAHAEEPVPSLPVFGENMDVTFSRAVRRCLDKDPTRRFKDGWELGAELWKAPEMRKGGLPDVLTWFVHTLRDISFSIGIALELSVMLLVVAPIGLAEHPRLMLYAAGLTLWFWWRPVSEMLLQTWLALREGYVIENLIHAVSVDIRKHHEGFAIYHRGAGGRIRRRVRRVTWGSLLAALSAVPFTGLNNPTMSTIAVTVFIGGFIVATLGAVIGYLMRRPARDWTGQCWLWFWQSPFGRLAVRIAGWGWERKKEPAPQPPELAMLSAPSYEQVEMESCRDLVNQAPAMRHMAESTMKRLRAWLDRKGTPFRGELTIKLAELEMLRHNIRDVRVGGERENITAAFEMVRRTCDDINRVLETGCSDNSLGPRAGAR